MSPTYWTEHDSPLGPLLLLADDGGLTGIYMQPHRHGPDGVDAAWIRDDERFAEARVQLDAYFVGELQRFELPLNPTGTAFQREVWAALRTIPYGETRSYGEIAEQIGRPGTARAVGLANGRNPLSIVVPCHRVVGASGSLTGYGGGIERKQLLLDLEARVAGHQLQP